MIESRLKRSALLRMIVIAGVIFVLMIPTLYIQSLIAERESRSAEALAEVSRSWGGAQVLTGPILTVPYTKQHRSDGQPVIRYAHFLPKRLRISGDLSSQIRHRGIFEVALFSGDLLLEGDLAAIDVGSLGIRTSEMLWEDAFVTLGISDLRGVSDSVEFLWNNKSYELKPGPQAGGVLESGITARPAITPGGSNSFSVRIRLNGSDNLGFVPVGELTTVSLKGAWTDPSFTGAYLPVSHEVTGDGFSAEWRTNSLNRSFPSAWMGDQVDLRKDVFGMKLYIPVDHYQKAERSTKYALLFIVLTFAALFLSEMWVRTILHPIQYALIGCALVLFYLLLLSLSEQVGFDTAYLLSSVVTISLPTLYLRWIPSSGRMPWMVSLVLLVLYLFLYVTLQLQDLALLVGTIGLVATLAAIMYVTRKIDWYGLDQGDVGSSQPK